MKKIEVEIISSSNVDVVNARIAFLLNQSNDWIFSDLKVTPYTTDTHMEYTIVAHRQNEITSICG